MSSDPVLGSSNEAGSNNTADAPEELVATIRGTRAGVIVLAGIGALNLGNAGFHLLTARLLGPAQYAEVVSLVAASGLIALPLGGVQVAVARFVASDAALGNAGAVAAFVRRATAAMLIFAGSLTAVLLLISPFVRHALGVHSLGPVLLTALYIFPALLAPLLWGVAQGLQRFGLISVSMTTGSVVRIALVAALAPFGISIWGVMGATLIGGTAALLAPAPLVWRWLRRPAEGQSPPPDREVLGYSLPVIAGTLAITSLTTIDLIVAKLALSSHDAGIYGSASFIGRLLLYLPTTVATVLLPKVTSRAAVNQDTKEILYASLAVTAVFSLAGTAMLVVLPHLVIDATFGSSYGAAVPLLGLFGLAMTVFALLNVLLVYHLGHGRRRVAWFLLGGAVGQLVLYAFVHGSTYQLVGADLASSLILLAAHEIFIQRTLPGAFVWLVRRVRTNR